MKIGNRGDLSITGLRYNADLQEYLPRSYAVLTDDGDLKYRMLYNLATKGRVVSDERLAGVFRALVAGIRARDARIERLEEEIRLQRQRIKLRDEIIVERVAGEVSCAEDNDRPDRDGRVPGYYGA